MSHSDRKRPTLKLWVRLTLSIIISLGIFLPIFEICLNSIKVKNTSTKVLYTYRVDKNSNYKVHLYDNSFTDNTEIEANKVYISDLVKNIKTNFSYTYSGTKKTNLTYEYNIKAKLYGENQNSQSNTNDIVWEKDYTLLDTVTKTTKNTTGFGINQELNIDYPTYKEEVLKFRKKFGIALTTKLEVTMNIKTTGKYNDNKIDRTDKIILEIPLGVQAFSITEDYKKQDTKNIYKQEKNLEIKNPTYTIACLLITIISIILFIISFKAIFNIKPKSKYTKELEKILKSYGDIIVEVTTPVKSKGLTTVQVKNFEEMLDLEEELRIPIILYESIYKHIAIFTITYNNTIYKYILKD